MKKIIALLLVFVVTGFAFSQTSEGLSTSNTEDKIKEVSVDKFESEGTWNVLMSSDEGLIKCRLFEGSPAAYSEENMNGKKAIPEEADMEVSDNNVLGVRVDYFRRGYNSFIIKPAKPLPVAGITKEISVFVVGRNYNHVIKLLLKDYWGRNFELTCGENGGKLNFQGWKKLTFSIPPQTGDGKHGIIQRDYHYNNRMGLKITGFKIECDPEDAYGSYYIYFDDLRANTDLYAEDHRDADDMLDNW